MNSLLWWFGAPIVGTGAVVAGLVMPLNRMGRRRLEALTAAQQAPSAPPAGGLMRVVVRKQNGTPVVVQADESAASHEEASVVAEPPVVPQGPLAENRMRGVARLFRSARRVVRTAPQPPSATETVVDADASLSPADSAIAVVDGPEVVEPHVGSPIEPAGLHIIALSDADTPAVAYEARVDDVVPTTATVIDDDEKMAPVAIATAVADVVDDEIVSTLPLAPPIERHDEVPLVDAVRERGIIDVEEAEPASEGSDDGRDALAARVEALRATQAAIEAERLQNEAEEQRRRDEVAAAEHQRETERLALAAEAEVRAKARARWWFYRLDLDLEFATVEQRMGMASSLGCVRAAWAPKLLREAFAQEQEPRVRARVIGALAEGEHFDPPTPFYQGFENGGVERAAVCEVLYPRRSTLSWAEELLAPVLEAL